MCSARLGMLVLVSGTLYARPDVVVAPLDKSIPSGVAVLTQSDPAFESLFEGLVPVSLRPLFQSILPYSVIVRNDTALPIVLVALNADVIDAQGHRRSIHQELQAVPPPRQPERIPLPQRGSVFFAVEQPYTELAYGQRSHEPIRSEFFAQTKDLPALHDSAKSVTFVLDAVLFADGTFAGPDTKHAFDKYSAQVAARLDVCKAILSFQGRSEDDLKEYLATASRPATEQYSSQYAMYFEQYAGAYQAVMRNKGPEGVFIAAQTGEKAAASLPMHR